MARNSRLNVCFGDDDAEFLLKHPIGRGRRSASARRAMHGRDRASSRVIAASAVAVRAVQTATAVRAACNQSALPARYGR